jgi:hypothetical protein
MGHPRCARPENPVERRHSNWQETAPYPLCVSLAPHWLGDARRTSLSPDTLPQQMTSDTPAAATLSPYPTGPFAGASARSPAGASQATESSRARNPTSILRRRSPLWADEGDTCDETASPSIMQKRQAMQTPPDGAAHSFATALLRSPMTIALGHLFELLHHADLVDVLTRLSNILNTSSGQNARTHTRTRVPLPRNPLLQLLCWKKSAKLCFVPSPAT